MWKKCRVASWPGLALAHLALLTACNDASPATRRPTAPASIRLIDELASAEVDSPLREAPSPSRVLAELDGLNPQWSWSADAPSKSADKQHGCRLAEGVLDCGAGRDFRLSFAVPAAPAT